jgi:phosphoserine phosphatase
METGIPRINNLSDFLLNSNATGCGLKLAIFDLDGTIHQGHISKKFGSYSDGDLLYFLFFTILKSPKKFFRIYPLYWILTFRYLVGRLKYKFGIIKRCTFEKILIEAFHFDISPHFSSDQLKREAKKCVNYAYPYVYRFIKYLHLYGFEIVIISKAHEVILQAYREYIKEIFFTNVKCISNPSIPNKTRTILPVLSSDDKYRLTNQVISSYTNLQKVLVVGDTEEDIGVYRAAKEKLKADENIFLISVGDRSKELMELANLRINEYKSLMNFLDKKGVAPPTHSRSARCRTFGDVISKVCRKNKVSQGISKKCQL